MYLFPIGNYYDWVSLTPKQIAQWDFPIVQISIDIRVIITHVHKGKWPTTMYLEAVVSKERASLLQRQHVIIVRDGSKLVTFQSNNNRYSGTFHMLSFQ